MQLGVSILESATLHILDGDDVYSGPWKTAVKEAGDAAEKLAKARSASRTGRMRASIGHRLEPERGNAMSIVITADATNHGFPYSMAIEFKGRYHHAGELRRAVEAAAPEAEKALSQAARQIERRWAAHGR